MSAAYERLVAYRRSVGRIPRLEPQVVRVNQLELAVFTTPPVIGTPPLLCINGGMLYDHSMLWPALAPLAVKRQLILYDQRGRGASSSAANALDTRIDDDASDVGALRRALGVRRWDVLGHSWGGGIAMLATTRDLAGVRRLVLVDAVGPDSSWIRPLRVEVLRRLTGRDREIAEAITESELNDPDPQAHSDYSRAITPAWFVDREMSSYFLPAPSLSRTGAAVLARLRREGYDWRAQLGAVSVPTLVLHGDSDPLPSAISTDLAYLLPNARREVLPASGHMPFWEAPDQFFALIDAFL